MNDPAWGSHPMRAGRKAQSILSDGKESGLLLGSQPTGLQTQGQSGQCPRHANSGGSGGAEGLLGGMTKKRLGSGSASGPARDGAGQP